MSQFAILSHRVPYFLALLMLMPGCQLSFAVRNKSGSILEAARDADLDFSEGQHRILISDSPSSKEFTELQSLLNSYDIVLVPYFPQSSKETSYLGSYNKTMIFNLKKLHGSDVYRDSCSKVYGIIYYPSASETEERDEQDQGKRSKRVAI